ncbi:MAG: hypothetical protein OEM67_08680 [Thermoleophilia bacterium]|nr:hypothetical protein [Thermoleophilia bacterium]MDH3724278.1 hypothetical protein [Thermoleophilia bacterium]
MFGERYGLERIHSLLAALGQPHRAAPAIHVVGSNGKSSTARFAAAALASAGLKAGAYLSPHVRGWHERLEVDGAPATPERFADAVSAVREAAGSLSEPVTQFEVLTAAAFVAFARERLDAMVIEAGLGGRYDATNVFDGSAVVALTRVDLEHTALLGQSRAEIAEEKLAVVHPGGATLVTGRLDADVEAGVARRSRETGVTQRRMGRDFSWSADGSGVVVQTPRATHPGLILAARGDFQRDNLAVGLAAAEERIERAIPTDALRERLGRLTIAGRAEIISHDPLIVADGAHNPAGAAAFSSTLGTLLGDRQAVLVTSVLDDKDLTGILVALAPYVGEVIATASSHARARAPEEIARAASSVGKPARICDDPASALSTARRLAARDGAIVIAGSLYLIEDLRRCALLRDE